MIWNHLWQSTLFAALVWVVARLFRENAARVRYRLWMAASLKFLLPFSMLLAAGRQVEWRSAPSAARPVSQAIEQAAQPFTPVGERPTAVILPSRVLPACLGAVWLIGLAVVSGRWWKRWQTVRLARRGATRLAIAGPVPVMSSDSRLEPGIFGLLRPVLLVPAGVEAELTAEQFQAILAHEFCHVRRRDNLTAALHMLVEAIFWFHPAVWWIGSRLVDERERACDEEVVLAGSDPETYAAGILRVCRLYLESPVVCAAGVTGAELKMRIEGIMRRQATKGVSGVRKLVMIGAGVAAMGGPVLVGMAQTGAPLRFEVASVKPAKDAGMRSGLNLLPGGGLKMDGVTLKGLIAFAYEVPEERISGGPKWLDSDAYDILAKAEKAEAGTTELQATTAAPGTPVWNRVRLRVQELLKDRFQLAIHTDSKETQGYALVVAKGGPKLKVSESKNPPSTMRSRGQIQGRGGSLGMLAAVLQNYLGHPVVDQTGLTATYDYVLSYGQDSRPGESDTAVSGPSITEAIEEQLGLKLEKSRVQIQSIVVDRAEKLVAN